MNLVLFDVDGTLLDTSAEDDRIFREALAENLPPDAQPPTIGPWHTFSEVTQPALAAAVFSRACGRRARDAEIMGVRQAVIRKWTAAVASGAAPVRVFPGARELFTAARQRPRTLVALATGVWEPAARLKLSAAGFTLEGTVLATADDSDTRQGIFNTASMLAASARGIPGFTATIVVGDGVWDAHAARTIGAAFVGIARDAETEARLRVAGATAIVPGFDSPDTFWRAVDTAVGHWRAARSN